MSLVDADVSAVMMSSSLFYFILFTMYTLCISMWEQVGIVFPFADWAHREHFQSNSGGKSRVILSELENFSPNLSLERFQLADKG